MAAILVVDDVRFISQMIASVFERIGHRVDTAADGEEALEKAIASIPDLIVMDVAMPVLDGIEVTRRLRAHDRGRDIPVLLVTSRADGETLTAAAQAGVDDHLSKPFEAPALLAKAARLLGGYPMTFRLELWGETAVVTALPEELGAAALDHVRPALEQARSAAPRRILLDLTRVAKVDPQVAEELLAVGETVRAGGGTLEVVRPSAGLGVRAFLSLVAPRLTIHDDLAAAQDALGLSPAGDRRPIATPRRPTARPASPGPAFAAAAAPARPVAAAGAGSVVRTGAARGVVLESHPQATIVRVHRTQLDDEVLDVLREEAGRARRAVLLEMNDVGAIDDVHARALGDAAIRASATGGSLRVVNPAPGVGDALERAGLGSLVLRTRASTRASS